MKMTEIQLVDPDPSRVVFRFRGERRQSVLVREFPCGCREYRPITAFYYGEGLVYDPRVIVPAARLGCEAVDSHNDRPNGSRFVDLEI